MSESELIKGCVKQDPKIQNLVYKQYASRVFGTCKRYMRDRERAEEMAMNTFLTLFKKIGQFKQEGSFEGWILRIAVNCCLMELRKKTNFTDELKPDTIFLAVDNTVTNELAANDIEKMLSILPEGARIVFNLYAVEGYKHAEIAEQLGISEGTSKSQLNYAKEKLKKAFFNNDLKNNTL
ncbi:MAG: RNA polymerase subunit sigma-70 [Flavobacterium sp. BFFFF1]|uniref:RNA polymerase sigma factor n=1 Tax=unclassified Flavobacterium TaxID=196869 RepID=UPI000BDC9B90|nr:MULTISPECIES: sigma-70 family RNA polymerase sigma factor [unclassified Flavobacterium]OYU81034.1 MAG: RNA polymerase subunit sigma-70 [Flavobacterium sp. BFFFF1]